jgi:hypothetical protein
MADGNDLQDVPFGEPEDDETACGGEGEPAPVEVDIETIVVDTETGEVVITEEEVLLWPDAQRGLHLSPVQLALYAGWTMAVLFGALPEAPGNRPAELPSLNELPAADRRRVEKARLRHLLSSLLPDFAGLAEQLSTVTVRDGDEETRARRSRLASLNLHILTALTATRPELQLAYELGRSLRDTASPPSGGAEGLRSQLERGRVAKLQEWLGTLAPEFPRRTAAVVAASLGRWSDLAQVTVGTNGTSKRPALSWLPQLPRQDKRAPIAASMGTYLLQQGDVWLMLLIGELATSGLLTPEGYVSAGEAALRRTGAIVRGIVRHYWFGLLCVAIALAGTLTLAALYLGGASRVWTSIACIAGGLGVSVQTIASTSSRLAAEAEQPVFAITEEDAIAWAITTMPPLPLTFRGVRHLRRAGVAPTASLGRF